MFRIFERFEELNLTISPYDVVNILFRCKMLFKVKSKNEYQIRIGGAISQVDEYSFAIPRIKKEL
jgi:hypothetical protein